MRYLTRGTRAGAPCPLGRELCIVHCELCMEFPGSAEHPFGMMHCPMPSWCSALPGIAYPQRLTINC